MEYRPELVLSRPLRSRQTCYSSESTTLPTKFDSIDSGKRTQARQARAAWLPMPQRSRLLTINASHLMHTQSLDTFFAHIKHGKRSLLHQELLLNKSRWVKIDVGNAKQRKLWPGGLHDRRNTSYTGPDKYPYFAMTQNRLSHYTNICTVFVPEDA